MKTVSLRAFRDSLGKVDPEAVSVEVVVRRGGYLITLGRWTPTGYLEPVRPFDDRPFDQTNHSSIGPLAHPIVAPVGIARPFTPAPKPGKR